MRVALIEVGHWHAKMHVRSLMLAGAHIVGVSDGNVLSAEKLASEVGCPAFQDFRDMLEVTHPEFVVAMGRHADMPAITRYLLEAGIPFAVEKPIGLAADQVAPLVEIARARNAFAAVTLVERYSPIWTWLDRLETAGRVGVRSHAHFRIVNGPPRRYELDDVSWMLDPAISGGGSMRNLGIHTVDAFRYFAGGEEIEVVGAAISYRMHGKPVEEMATAVLRSKSGIIGTVEAGYSFASMTTGDFEWRVAAANCYLVDRDQTMQVATLDDGQTQTMPVSNQAARYDQFGVDTLERLSSGRPPIATIEDCYHAMRVIDDIYRKAVRIPYPP